MLDHLRPFLDTIDGVASGGAGGGGRGGGPKGPSASERHAAVKSLLEHLGKVDVQSQGLLSANQRVLHQPGQWRTPANNIGVGGLLNGSCPAFAPTPYASRPPSTLSWDDLLTLMLKYAREVCFPGDKDRKPPAGAVQQQAIAATLELLRFCDAAGPAMHACVRPMISFGASGLGLGLPPLEGPKGANLFLEGGRSRVFLRDTDEKLKDMIQLSPTGRLPARMHNQSGKQ